MLRKAPPLETVEVFVVAAKGGNFRAVARDLALSPSAVSRRIAGLEEFLGVLLFDRSGLRAITGATDAMTSPRGERLRVATSHSFASTWLLPRLPALLEEAGVNVELVIGASFDALASNEAGIGIWGGRIAPDGLKALRQFELTAVPVAPTGCS